MAEATESLGTQQHHANRSDTAVEPALFGMLLKDVAVIFAALSLWAAADTWYQVTELWIAQVLAVGDAVLVGLLIAALFHEWGHYSGAMAAGASATRFNPKGLSLFRFNFNYAQNDTRQFHWMTSGGHIAHWSILLVLLITVPLDSMGRIALVSAVFGFIVFASVIEYNIVKDTRAGVDPETRLSALTAKDIQQAGVIGAIAGLFAMALFS